MTRYDDDYKIKKQTVPAYFRHILTEVVKPYNTRNTFFEIPHS